MNNIKDKDKQFIADTYARFDVLIKSGKGSLCYDENGKEYIDLTTGIGVNAFGFCDDVWKTAVTEQLDKLQHISNLYYTEPCVALAEKLIGKTEHLKKVFFSNSGLEANECAIKAARKYAADKKGADCYKIITLKDSFHGRSITTLAATGQDSFHKDFLPLTDGFIYVNADDIDGLKKAVSENKIAAVMFETVQGEGGVHTLSSAFVDEIQKLQQQDIVLIADEVQTGNGRTGKYFAYMHFGIKPDIVTTAKGLGGGLPIGATLFSDKTKDVLTKGTHGSTFGANPVACAGALSVVERIDNSLMSKVNEKSNFIKDSLCNVSGVKSISGMGLMLGVETEKNADEIVKQCMEQGVLIIKAKAKLRLLPALNIPFEQLEKAIAVVKKAIES